MTNNELFICFCLQFGVLQDLAYIMTNELFICYCLQFDGVLQGLGELADMMMNELGVGEIIVKKQKRYSHRVENIYLEKRPENSSVLTIYLFITRLH